MTETRNDATPDPERIARLLDGQLGEREREALLAELAASDDGLELLGDAAALLREMEDAGDLPADPPVPIDIDPDRVRRTTASTRVTLVPIARPSRLSSVVLVRRARRAARAYRRAALPLE